MFDQLKKIRELSNLKDALSKEKIVVEKNGVKIVVNGEMKVEEIHLNPQLETSEQEKILKECFQEAQTKIQSLLLEKFSGMKI